MRRAAAALAGIALTAAAVYFYLGPPVPEDPGFHERRCWFNTRIIGEAQCGYFVVRENRQKPDSRTIALPVVVLKAEDGTPQREPILYLDGGPGARALLATQQEIDGWSIGRKSFPPGHDVILVGQRGTGLDGPDFDCPELKTAEISLAAHAPGTSPPDFRALSTQGVIDCSRRLLSEGVDLSAYNSRESAADIAELRRALGIENWTLYGISYGTRLALSVLRYHPEGVQAVILDSVVPPEAAEGLDVANFFGGALREVFRDCAADADCTRRHGDLEAAYTASFKRLKARPAVYALSDFLDPEELVARGATADSVITIDHTWFDLLLLDALVEPEAAGLIPLLLSEVSARGPSALVGRLRETLRITLDQNDFSSVAVYLSHICRDEAPFRSAADIAAAIEKAGDLGYLVADHWPNHLCAHWPAGAADPVENTPVESAVPALLLAGRFDPLTPPALARQAARHLSNGHAFTFADTSHGALFESPCARRLVERFLETLDRPSAGLCQSGEVVVSAGD